MWNIEIYFIATDLGCRLKQQCIIIKDTFSQDWQKNFFEGLVKALFACLKCYFSLLLVSQNIIVVCIWEPSSMGPKGTLATAERPQYQHTLSAPLPWAKTRSNSKRRLHLSTLSYESTIQVVTFLKLDDKSKHKMNPTHIGTVRSLL